MNEENYKRSSVIGVDIVEQEVAIISKDKARKHLKRMKEGKAVGPHMDGVMGVWFLAESEMMPEQ